MKNELYVKFQELLQTEDIASIQDEVRALLDNYKDATEKEEQSQKDTWNEQEHPEGEEFSFAENPIDEKLKVLNDKYQSQLEELKNSVEEVKEIVEESPVIEESPALEESVNTPVEDGKSEEKSEESMKVAEEPVLEEKVEEVISETEEIKQPIADAEVPTEEEVKDVEESEKEAPVEPKENIVGKENIFKRYNELLETGEVSVIKHEMRDLLSNYNSETAKEKHLQLEEWKKAEHEEGEEFAFERNPLDEKLDELVASYKEQVKEHGKKIAEEQGSNLKQKEDLLSQLKALISEEENIGKAFATFKEIQEKWNAIGNIPGNKFREIQDDFFKLKEEFYYNINIYRELQDNALKINEDKKKALIEKAKALLTVESIRESDVLVKTYQKEWMDLGPSTRDNYQALGDEFFGLCRQVIDKIRAHYDSLHEENDKNLALKKELVEEMKNLVELEITNHSTWSKKTDDVIAVQGKWKGIGFARKQDNEIVWQEFRALCDLFFERKNKFYEKRKEVQADNKLKKEELVAKAKELVGSEDWKTTTEALINLQKEWKAVGPTFQKHEQGLWSSFRGACDKFFEAKKAFFSNIGQVQEDNLKLKKDLITEIEAFELTGNRSEDLDKLKSFSNRFNEIGFVPKKNLSELFDSYNAALDGKYDALKMKREEKSLHNYQQRVDNLKSVGDSDSQITREKRLLRDKIEKLKHRMDQYENNLNFFTGGGAAAMKKEVEKKISAAAREIEEIKKKLQML